MVALWRLSFSCAGSVHRLSVNFIIIVRMDINVTKPYLPPLEEYIDLMRNMELHQLTNNGHFSQQLENDLSDYLDVPNVTLFSNGTAALIASIKCLELREKL